MVVDLVIGDNNAPPSGPTMHLVSGTMGSDETGDGTLENPFATIGHAMFNMNNND